jgi:hypothetical protein
MKDISPNLSALRKEVIHTVLKGYLSYAVRCFSKNPGNTSAEICEKQ